MMIHLPHQIFCTFVLNIQHIYAPQRLKPPFARNDQDRLYVLEVLKFMLLRMNSMLTVLNMGYKLDLLHPKQEVF